MVDKQAIVAQFAELLAEHLYAMLNDDIEEGAARQRWYDDLDRLIAALGGGVKRPRYIHPYNRQDGSEYALSFWANGDDDSDPTEQDVSPETITRATINGRFYRASCQREPVCRLWRSWQMGEMTDDTARTILNAAGY